MSTEASFLPMDISALLNQQQASSLQEDDPFLQELISNQGVSLSIETSTEGIIIIKAKQPGSKFIHRELSARDLSAQSNNTDKPGSKFVCT